MWARSFSKLPVVSDRFALDPAQQKLAMSVLDADIVCLIDDGNGGNSNFSSEVSAPHEGCCVWRPDFVAVQIFRSKHPSTDCDHSRTSAAVARASVSNGQSSPLRDTNGCPFLDSGNTPHLHLKNKLSQAETRKLQPIAAMALMKVMYAARMCRTDLLRAAAHLACFIKK